MGLYEKFRGKIEAFKEPPERQAKIEAWKASFLAAENNEDASIQMLCLEFAKRQQNKKSLKKALKLTQIEIDALSQMIVEGFENDSLKKIEVSIGTVSLADKPFPKVVDQTIVNQWFIANGMVDMLKTAVAWGTLKKMSNDRLKKGSEYIPGTAVFMKTEAKVTGLARLEGDEEEDDDEDDSSNGYLVAGN